MTSEEPSNHSLMWTSQNEEDPPNTRASRRLVLEIQLPHANHFTSEKEKEETVESTSRKNGGGVRRAEVVVDPAPSPESTSAPSSSRESHYWSGTGPLPATNHHHIMPDTTKIHGSNMLWTIPQSPVSRPGFQVRKLTPRPHSSSGGGMGQSRNGLHQTSRPSTATPDPSLSGSQPLFHAFTKRYWVSRGPPTRPGSGHFASSSPSLRESNKNVISPEQIPPPGIFGRQSTLVSKPPYRRRASPCPEVVCPPITPPNSNTTSPRESSACQMTGYFRAAPNSRQPASSSRPTSSHRRQPPTYHNSRVIMAPAYFYHIPKHLHSRPQSSTVSVALASSPVYHRHHQHHKEVVIPAHLSYEGELVDYLSRCNWLTAPLEVRRIPVQTDTSQVHHRSCSWRK